MSEVLVTTRTLRRVRAKEEGRLGGQSDGCGHGTISGRWRGLESGRMEEGWQTGEGSGVKEGSGEAEWCGAVGKARGGEG
jgi:hypothetical protein